MTIGMRIREARKAMGLSQVDLAQRIGSTQAAISRWEKDINAPSRTTYERLAKILSVPASHLAFGSAINLNSPQPVEAVSVLGIIEAGAFREALSVEGEFRRISFVPHPDYKAEDQVAFLVRGESCNEVVGDGDHVIAVPYSSFPGGLEALLTKPRAPLVVVQRERAGLIEATLKELRVQSDRLELWPRSNHPDHQERIELNENGDTDGVSITHVVIRIVSDYV